MKMWALIRFESMCILRKRNAAWTRPRRTNHICWASISGTAYYFYYNREHITTLNREFLHTVKTQADGYVIYADLCTLSDGELERFHITFKKIPRDISKL